MNFRNSHPRSDSSIDRTKRVEIGEHLLEGEMIPLPPIVLGSYGNDPKKPTLLVYAHYDVQPALLSDGWATDPFVLTEKVCMWNGRFLDLQDGRLFGRGASDDKGKWERRRGV